METRHVFSSLAPARSPIALLNGTVQVVGQHLRTVHAISFSHFLIEVRILVADFKISQF